MTNSQMFLAAHKQAKVDAARFGDDMNSYRACFGRALRGFYMVRNGYDGSFVREGRRQWA